MKHLILFLSFILILFPNSYAQNYQISGVVKDAATGELLPGADIQLKGTTKGTRTDIKGNFSLIIRKDSATVMIVSYLGYQKAEVKIKHTTMFYTINLEPTYIPGDEVVITASRFSEKILESSSAIQKLNSIKLTAAPSGDFFKSISNQKEVEILETSMGFRIFNTRGFNTSSPFRVVQFVDGIDNQAVSFNFPPGNLFGLPDVDIDNVEVISGPASAMYGPNAFQGVISMTSVSPFNKQGVTVSIKGGNRKFIEAQFRMADVFGKNKKFGVKISGSYMQSEEWLADDPISNLYKRTNSPPQDLASLLTSMATDSTLSIEQRQLVNDFNTYATTNTSVKPGKTQFTLPGYMEKYLYDGKNRNIKASANIFYKLPYHMMISYQYRFNDITGIYQGNSRSRIKNMLFQQHKLELKGKNFLVRTYFSMDDVKDSYDLVLTGINLGLAGLPAVDKAYLLGYLNDIKNQSGNFTLPADSINLADAKNAGMAMTADAWLKPGTEDFNTAFDRITTSKDRYTGGSMFTPHSKLVHADGQYDFNVNIVKFNAGASFRYYMPQSEGKHFMDTLLSDGNYSNISFYELGGFLQGSTELFKKHLKCIASIRVDKSENFNFQFSPRIGLIFTVKEHNIRLFAQSAFRNPTLNDQYFNMNNGSFIARGNLGGFSNIYTLASVTDYQSTGDTNKLQPIVLNPIRPEHLNAVELGYRTALFRKLVIDANGYFNMYSNFIGSIKVVRPKSGTAGEHSGTAAIMSKNYQTYSVAVNSTTDITAYGASIGVSYYFPLHITAYANYTFSKMVDPKKNDPLIPGFNTPEHKVNVGFEGQRIYKNLGASFNFKWWDSYLWTSPFATGEVPSNYTMDVQLSYELQRWYTTVRVGMSNILDRKYIQAYGSGQVGRFMYASLSFDLKGSTNRH